MDKIIVFLIRFSIYNTFIFLTLMLPMWLLGLETQTVLITSSIISTIITLSGNDME